MTDPNTRPYFIRLIGQQGETDVILPLTSEEFAGIQKLKDLIDRSTQWDKVEVKFARPASSAEIEGWFADAAEDYDLATLNRIRSGILDQDQPWPTGDPDDLSLVMVMYDYVPGHAPIMFARVVDRRDDTFRDWYPTAGWADDVLPRGHLNLPLAGGTILIAWDPAGWTRYEPRGTVTTSPEG